VAAGLLTRKQLGSSAWRRILRDVYADTALPRTHGTAITGAALISPASAVFAGRSAAFLLGAESLADESTPVEIVVPEMDRFGPVSGLRVRRTLLADDEVRSVGRLFCTTPLRTALDIARSEDLVDAVVALDVLLARGLVRRSDLVAAAAALPTGRGTRRAVHAVDLADERAESPPESRLRLLLRSAGLRPEPQYVIRDGDGRFVARVDLAFPEHRIAIEYDGAWHGRPGQLARDRRRLNALVAAGWTVLHVTAADMHEPTVVVASVRTLLGRRERGDLDLSLATGRATSPRSAVREASWNAFRDRARRS
jgi:very-short-patch-repair endonuclease